MITVIVTLATALSIAASPVHRGPHPVSADPLNCAITDAAANTVAQAVADLLSLNGLLGRNGWTDVSIHDALAIAMPDLRQCGSASLPASMDGSRLDAKAVRCADGSVLLVVGVAWTPPLRSGPNAMGVVRLLRGGAVTDVAFQCPAGPTS